MTFRIVSFWYVWYYFLLIVKFSGNSTPLGRQEVRFGLKGLFLYDFSYCIVLVCLVLFSIDRKVQW